MLEKEVYESHLSRIINIKWPKVMAAFFFLLALFLLIFVNLGENVGIPIEVQYYLLKIPFWEFSTNEFNYLVVQTDTKYNSLVLLNIYWGSHIIVPLIPFFLILDRFIKRKLKKLDKAYLLVKTLNKESKYFLLQPNSLKAKLKFEAALESGNIGSIISPIMYDWHKDPLYKWFELSEISSDIKSILLCFKDFNGIIDFSINEKYEVNKTKEALGKR